MLEIAIVHKIIATCHILKVFRSAGNRFMRKKMNINQLFVVGRKHSTIRLSDRVTKGEAGKMYKFNSGKFMFCYFFGGPQCHRILGKLANVCNHFTPFY